MFCLLFSLNNECMHNQSMGLYGNLAVFSSIKLRSPESNESQWSTIASLESMHLASYIWKIAWECCMLNKCMELSGNLSNNSNHLAGYLKHQQQNQKQMKSSFYHLRSALFVPTSCFLLKVAVTKLSHGAQYLNNLRSGPIWAVLIHSL